MAEQILLDSGALIALANAKDRSHRACVKAVSDLRAQLVTVEGVLVEAAFVLSSRGASNTVRLLELFSALHPVRHAVSPAGLVRVGQLMRQYKRMDFVDGLLLVAADELNISKIVTLDRRDFAIYRKADGSPLEMIP